MGVRQLRCELTQQLRRMARAYGIHVMPDTVGRAKVEGMYDAIAAHAGVSAPHLQAADDIFRKYTASWGAGYPTAGGPRDQHRSWKFKAVHFTYNCATGEWASKDRGVLKGLFDRLVAFYQGLVVVLGASV